MKIYTSYLARASKLQAKGLLPIAIVRFLPKNVNMIDLKTLAPSKELLFEYKRTLNTTVYTHGFNKVLASKNPEDVINTLELISKQHNNRDIVLICYEKTGDFCHRHLVANWLNDSKLLSYPIEECQL